MLFKLFSIFDHPINPNIMFDRRAKAPNICGIQLDFGGTLIPSNIVGFQPFFNSVAQNAQFQNIYHGKSTVSFSEESSKSAAGISWKQKIVFRFPVTDSMRATTLSNLHKIKSVKIELTNGLFLVIGRNDFFQNKRPDIAITANEKMAALEISSLSISPAGFIPDLKQYQLPAFIPLTLI